MPPCLPDYQSYLRGVDRVDQMRGYYNLGRRSKDGGREFCIFNRVLFLNVYILLSFVKTGLSVHEGSYLYRELP